MRLNTRCAGDDLAVYIDAFTALPPALAEPMRALVDDLELVTISRCGHWTPQERPDELNEILVGWLQRRFGASA